MANGRTLVIQINRFELDLHRPNRRWVGLRNYRGVGWCFAFIVGSIAWWSYGPAKVRFVLQQGSAKQ